MSLILGIIAHVVVLLDCYEFYTQTFAYNGARLDTCSGTPEGYLIGIIALVGLFVGMPLGVWGVGQCLTKKLKGAVLLALVAVALNLTPYSVGGKIYHDIEIARASALVDCTHVRL